MAIFRPSRALIVAGLTSLALAAAFVVAAGPVNPFRNDDDLERIDLGRSVYETRCAMCHGKKLEGQPDWQKPLPSGRLPAPPHDATGHTWHHADDVLIGVTKNGLKPYAGDDYESDMPAFGGVLSDREIEAVISYIKRGWPEREREYQKQITAQSKS